MFEEGFFSDFFGKRNDSRIEDYALLLFEELLAKGLQIATAESCTGGLLSDALVSVSGISEVFHGGFVTYSDEYKEKFLGVSKKTLSEKTAVSEEVSSQMALGLKSRTGADICLTTTGIAGPTGGTEEIPVGTVFISCAYADKVATRSFCFSGDREAVRRSAVREALLLALSCVDRLS